MEIFDERPKSWGLRGDPEMWEKLKVKFRNYDYANDPQIFNKDLEEQFNLIVETGRRVSDEEVYFEEFSPKGMSGGYISLRFWNDIALNLLKRRYKDSHLEILQKSFIWLHDILPLEQLKLEGKVLLIRHVNTAINEMFELGVFEEYQSFQNMPAFRTAKYIISFLAEPNNQAVLYGVFKLEKILEKDNLPPYSHQLVQYCKPQNNEEDFFLVLKRVNEFHKFEGRLIIDWVVPRGWYNTYGEVKDKPVVKLLPRNFSKEFPGLPRVNLSAPELRKIIENPESNSKWKDALTKLQAVYLILDQASGAQYVGTTYGQSGLWQRWESYVKSGFTGGNVILEKMKAENPNFYFNFRFTILEVLPINAGKNECLEAESNWKLKLGSRANGLNAN